MEQVLYWLVGGLGVPLIQWLKGSLGVRGAGAVWLTAAVSVFLALGALFLSRRVSPADFSAANLVAVFGQVLAAATLAYKLLVREGEL
jgi:hypothetical protein